MKYLIPVKSTQASKKELNSLLQSIEKNNSGVEVNHKDTSGLAMDTETVTIIVDIAKTTIPALITLLGSVWVAHINKNADKKKTATPNPSIIVETTINNIRIELATTDIKKAVESAKLPESTEDIVRIRFE